MTDEDSKGYAIENIEDDSDISEEIDELDMDVDDTSDEDEF